MHYPVAGAVLSVLLIAYQSARILGRRPMLEETFNVAILVIGAMALGHSIALLSTWPGVR